MVEADRRRFAVAMAGLGVAFDREPSAERMGLYWDALVDLRIEAVEWAAKRAIRELVWFPKAKELRDLAGLAPKPAGVGRRISADEVKRLVELTPPEVARENLARIAAELNGSFGTALRVDESRGRPELVSDCRRRA